MNPTELKRMRRYPESCWSSLHDANGPINWADFQVRLFHTIDDILLGLIGREKMPERRHLWLEWPTGHGKTFITAIVVAFVLAFSQRKVTGAIVDRSGAVRQNLALLLEWNGWLGDTIEISSEKRAANPRNGSTVRIFADQPALSACDFLIADSVADWPDSWSSTWAAAVSQAGCLFVTCSGGGSPDSWQSSIRSRVRADENWHFDRIDHPVATWAEKSAAERQRIISAADADRIFRCSWGAPGIVSQTHDAEALARMNERPAERIRRINAIARSCGLDVDDDEPDDEPAPARTAPASAPPDAARARRKRLNEIARTLGLE